MGLDKRQVYTGIISVTLMGKSNRQPTQLPRLGNFPYAEGEFLRCNSPPVSAAWMAMLLVHSYSGVAIC